MNLGGAISEEVEDDEREKDESSIFNGIVYGRKLDICGGNISLYIDFSGTLSRVNYSNLNGMDCSRVLVSQEDAKGNGDEEMKKLMEKFRVGDIVWAKTKNQS